jgi:hypothetical protein
MLRDALIRFRRPLAAVVTGGSLAGFLAVHAVHAAAVAGGPMVVQFVCRIAH